MRLGIDIVQVNRIKKLLKSPEALKKVFLVEELEAVNRSALRLAGRWAAKEAFFKAYGKKIDWLSIRIENQESGEPVMRVEGFDAEVQVSISHEEEYAVAVVIIMKYEALRQAQDKHEI